MKRTYCGWFLVLLAFCSPGWAILYVYGAWKFGVLAWHVPVIAALLGGAVGMACGYVGMYLLDPDNFREPDIEMFGPANNGRKEVN